MPSLIRSIRKESANRRIGIKRPCLQHEAGDDDHGCRRITGGNAGVRPGSARENQRLQEASGRVWAVLRFDSVESESRGVQNAPLPPSARLPRYFHTAWARTGGSRRRDMMPAIEVEADGRRSAESGPDTREFRFTPLFGRR